MTNIILCFINCILFFLYCYHMSVFIFGYKVDSKIRVALSFIFFSLIYMLNVFVFNSIYAVFFSCFMYIILFKILYSNNNLRVIFLTTVVYNFSVIIKALFLLLWKNESVTNVICSFRTYSVTQFVVDMIAILVSALCIYLLRHQLVRLKKWLYTRSYKLLMLLIILFVDILIVCYVRYDFVLYDVNCFTSFIVIFLLIILFILSTRMEDNQKYMMKHYKDLFEYSKVNDELINDYKMKLHDVNNRLLVIRGMLSKKDKEVINYIDSVLDNNNTFSNYVFDDLRYLTFPGIKMFINSKLNYMKSLGTDIELLVSEDVSKLETSIIDKKNQDDIYTILGIIIDNMCDCLSNNEDKKASISIYIDNNYIIGEFANNFEGEIDLNKIYDLGYSSNGNNRGYGLPLVKKIIKKNDMLNVETKIVDNFFVQRFSVDLSKSKIVGEYYKK